MSTDRSLFEDRVEMLLAEHGWPRVDSDAFRKMDQHQKRMAALFILENEVAGGGFARAYFNQHVELGVLASEAYEAIGAREHARVVKQSVDAAKKNAALGSGGLKSGPEKMLETMSEDHIRSGFAQVDKDWAAISGVDTASLKFEYMRRHSASFGIVLPKNA